VSIRDVAVATGVSIATVSRVINGSSMVAQPTAAKVREAIRRLNYVPTRWRRRSRLVGAMC
jgi:DNA-binding LacI/PurR family transcriptional regulator